MAEKAAHFSYTSVLKPSIFEIIAQSSLNSTLQPAFQKISEFLAESNSSYFHWLLNYQEESFLVFNGLLQFYYLKNHDASFAEYFYGLRRVSIEDFPLSQKFRSVLFMVLVPYIKHKLAKRIDEYKIQDAEGLLINNWKSRFKRYSLYTYSAGAITWNVWILLNYLRYMSDQTESQHPILHLLKLKLVYADEPEDVFAFWSALFNRRLNLKEFGAGLLQNGIRTSFELGAFFIQFLQAWHNEKQNYSITALPKIPPPDRDPNADAYRSKCPICLQPWKIPTAVPVSGYVFCFACILKHLREEPRCPVTKYPAKPMDLVRLYDS